MPRITLSNVALQDEFEPLRTRADFIRFPRFRWAATISPWKPRDFAAEKDRVAVDADAAVTIDAVLEIGPPIGRSRGDRERGQRPDAGGHRGDASGRSGIGGAMAALPLNGRSYTDLLAIQPGVSPMSTLTPTSVIMAGVTGTINPSGDANPGDVSIDGQRESANGFLVNGVDVGRKHMNGGTSVIPNLDSIQEFRVLTNNFDPEYGNYNGGMVNVVTKSGSKAFHGDAFEFLRNTDLDARNYFRQHARSLPAESVRRNARRPHPQRKLFFFSDYQGTRTSKASIRPRPRCPRSRTAPAISAMWRAR
jgi:hypothetical protein